MKVQLKRAFPKGALSFYIELYCKRANVTEKKRIAQQEALKSWISLNKCEKIFFERKYNEHHRNFKKSIAMRLKNAIPYMKPKVMLQKKSWSQHINSNNDEICKEISQTHLLSSKIEVDDCAHHIPGTQNEENTEMDIHDSYNYCDIALPITKTSENILLTPKIDEDDTKDSVNHTSDKTEIDEREININSPIPNLPDEEISIPEPTAPKIMTGQELFLIIKEREENDLMWEELTKPQKRRYTDAVLAIKRKYLKEYREYLEHLSPKKLFNYYRNILYSVQ